MTTRELAEQLIKTSNLDEEFVIKVNASLGEWWEKSFPVQLEDPEVTVTNNGISIFLSDFNIEQILKNSNYSKAIIQSDF